MNVNPLISEILTGFQKPLPYQAGTMKTRNHEALADLLETSELVIEKTIIKYWRRQTDLRETDTGLICDYLEEDDLFPLAKDLLDKTDSHIATEYVAGFLEEIELYIA